MTRTIEIDFWKLIPGKKVLRIASTICVLVMASGCGGSSATTDSVVTTESVAPIETNTTVAPIEATTTVAPFQSIAPINADVKEGDGCSKEGITSVTSSKSYTCSLVEHFESTSQGERSLGKNLLWMLTVAPSCNPPVMEKVAPTPTPVKKKAQTFQSIAPIKSTDYPLIGTLAKNTILNQKASLHDPFIISWDPTTTDFKRKFYSEQIEIMKKYFSPMIPKNSNADLYILGSDKEWACEVFKKAPDPQMFFNMYQVSSKCATTPQGVLILDAESGDYTNYRGAGAGFSVLGHGVGMVATSNCDEKYLERDLLIHETFHAIQWIYTSHKLDSEEAIKFPSLKESSPLWMAEGSATYMGYLLSADGKWTSFGEDKRGNILSNSGNWKLGYEKFNEDMLEAYSIGAVMYEYLLAKYGLERTLSFWPEAINSIKPSDITNFLARDAAGKETFQRVFGLSVEDFFIEVKPYIEWSLKHARRVP